VTRVLAAGDYFVSSEKLSDALKAAVNGSHELSFTELTLDWPLVPFGPVDGVNEASGTVDGLIQSIDGASLVLTQMAPFTAKVFEKCPELRFIGVCRGGPVNVDLGAATRAGVVVSYTPARNAQAAAEFAIGLMLAAMRRIASGDAELKRGQWRGDYYTYEQTGLEIQGNTVGLVGYGAIGRIVAGILNAFGANVVAFDPYADADAAAREKVTILPLDEVLRQSHIVSIHARLTPETRHLLNAANLALLPKGAVLVNSARGDLLDYSVLPALLESGQLGALALDVYDEEPPGEDWPLRHAPNVLMTPHLAGATRQTAERAATGIANEAALFLNGRAPTFVANPEVLSGLDLAQS
jgi:D-3-phosphoglycerate dehydrogenase